MATGENPEWSRVTPLRSRVELAWGVVAILLAILLLRTGVIGIALSDDLASRLGCSASLAEINAVAGGSHGRTQVAESLLAA